MLVFLSGGMGDQLTRLAQALYVRERCPRVGKPVLIFLLTSTFNCSLPSQSANISSLMIPAVISERSPSGVSPRRLRPVAVFLRRAFRWLLVRFAGVMERRAERSGGSPPDFLSSYLFFGGWPDKKTFRKKELESFGFPDGVIPREPTQQFYELSSFLQKTKVIGVHIRLRDFVENDLVPDPSFYQEALATLKNQAQFDEVWLFSDDPNSAESLLGTDVFDLCPSSSGQLSAVEELALLTQCSGLVLSRSSFSWWAQFMNAKDALTVSP